MANPRRPLAGVVIVDAVAGPLGPATRYLAELGANVIRVETAKTGKSTLAILKDAAANNGKSVQAIDFGNADDVAKLDTLIESADCVIIDSHHELSRRADLIPAALHARFPQKLIV